MKQIVELACRLVEAASGNRLGAAQMHMVESRLRRRMAQLGISNPSDYGDYLAANRGTETSILVSLLTTHHTFFFREFIHYEFIHQSLPALAVAARARGDKTLRFWSAACSRGQEAYSLAMFLETYLPKVAPDLGYTILGTDIDTECVKYAHNAVYPFDEVKECPRNLLGWWDRGTGDIAEFVRIKKALRDKCTFVPANLDRLDTYPKEKFDTILCRNVLIYFEEEKVKLIASNLKKCIHPGGYLITGVSESLTSHLAHLDLLSAPQASVYQVRAEHWALADSAKAPAPGNSPKVAPSPTSSSTSSPTSVSTPGVPTGVASTTPAVVVPGSTASTVSVAPRRPIRVVNVDDSPTVLKLLGTILTPKTGFEVVGTAENGKIAAEVISRLKPDAVTLDIHMPEVDGLTYLQKNFTKSHPPVVVISSASRLDSDVALKAIQLGASDFIEKPSLGNMEFRGNEIRTKIQVAIWNANEGGAAPSVLEQQISHAMPVIQTEGRARISLCNMSSWSRLTTFLGSLTWNEPPLFLFFEGHKEILGALRKRLSTESKFSVVEMNDKVPAVFEKNTIYLADLRTFYPEVQSRLISHRVSTLLFGLCSDHALGSLQKSDTCQILMEDMGVAPTEQMLKVATDIVPATSFPYMSNAFLATEVASEKFAKTGS